eukprot:6174217-Pleurochrysis_carterae.AAC.2
MGNRAKSDQLYNNGAKSSFKKRGDPILAYLPKSSLVITCRIGAPFWNKSRLSRELLLQRNVFNLHKDSGISINHNIVIIMKVHIELPHPILDEVELKWQPSR